MDMSLRWASLTRMDTYGRCRPFFPPFSCLSKRQRWTQRAGTRGVHLTVKRLECVIMYLPTPVKRTLYKKKEQKEKLDQENCTCAKINFVT